MKDPTILRTFLRPKWLLTHLLVIVLVELFNCPVECRAQTVGGIASTLGKTNACCAAFVVGIVDCHTFPVAVVGFDQAGPFILCEGNAVVKEQVVTIT